MSNDVAFGRSGPTLPGRITTVGALWALAIVVYGVGDLVSTLVGLQLGAAESNPLPAALIELAPGFLAVAVVLTLYKAASIALFAAFAWRLPSPYGVSVPIALSLVGIGVVGWNASVILSLVS